MKTRIKNSEGGSFGELWRETTPLRGFTSSELPNPHGYFFAMLSSFKPVVFVLMIWLINAWIVRRGAETIEKAVRLFVPAMWILMAMLAVRGLTLSGGLDGVWYLFTPDFEIMKNIAVWQGAFCQIFFTLSVGFGVMTAYASYLPEKNDQTSNAIVIASLNCGFEYLAGIVLGYSLWLELSGGLYGSSYTVNFKPEGTWLDLLPKAIPLLWLLGSAGAAWLLASSRRKQIAETVQGDEACASNF